MPDKPIVETDRFAIIPFNESMAESVRDISLDEDNRRFVPDEVFETAEEARAIVGQIMAWYKEERAPLVYAIVLKGGEHIGHVQAVPLDESEWEIGYHIAAAHTGKGYATDAAKAFLPHAMKRLALVRMWGICRADNVASRRVLEKCGFALEYTGPGAYQGASREICRYRVDVDT